LIQYLDSDDELLPDKLHQQMTLLENHPDAVMCYYPTSIKRIGIKALENSQTSMNLIFSMGH